MSQAMMLNQLNQLENPDGVITFSPHIGTRLGDLATVRGGITTGDSALFRRCFWEVPSLGTRYTRQQATVDECMPFGGRELVLLWDGGEGLLKERASEGATIAGRDAWGKPGIVISRVRTLAVTLYGGEPYENVCFVLVPKNPEHLEAFWAFTNSDAFHEGVRNINQALSVDPRYFHMSPFDLGHWQKVAENLYPNGLPESHSDDPTQWLFCGDIPSSANTLQVAAARLLGYRWLDQPEGSIDAHADEDGIVTLAPLVNQDGITGRLRALLQSAYESEAPTRPQGAPEPKEPRIWTEAVIPNLLSKAGSSGMSLEEWLRDKFFEAHCKLFHQRPFIWHIWDGRKDGFHAYVNYHKLDKKNLERLTHVYLGEWIERQKAAADSGDRTADGRLGAAQELQRKLELIRLGEPPYDIFVRWKPLHEQPIGWEPDLNDGVRMNIRPFIEAGILRGRVNVNWNKDRGKDPKPNLSGTVERHNDLHFTLAQKLEARGRRKPS